MGSRYIGLIGWIALAYFSYVTRDFIRGSTTLNSEVKIPKKTLTIEFNREYVYLAIVHGYKKRDYCDGCWIIIHSKLG